MQYVSQVLNPTEFDYVVNKTLNGNEWSFGQKSNDTDSSGFSFWQLELTNDQFFSKHFLGLIERAIGKKLQVIRIYANGQTHGQPGSVHKDDEDPNCWTFIFYANPNWNVEWGGETVFLTESGMMAVTPEPNAGVFFQSNIPHFGRDPSRHYDGLRVTVAFKLKEKQ
jgi:Rps23 Pro-64 3,4-dihydroxylase Tpa1-like proline 4-hydroxylase